MVDRRLITRGAAGFLVASLVLVVWAGSAAACTKTWTGAGGDNKASNAQNWSVCPNSSPSVPGASDDVSLQNAGLTIDLDTGLTVHSWTMGTQPGSSVTLIGRAVGSNTGVTAPAGFTNGPHGSIVLDGGNGAVAIASASDAGSGTLANQGSITLESTSPTGLAQPPALVGNLTNTGAITVDAASQFQGGYTLDNRGSIDLANGVVLATTGAGPATVINDAGGHITAPGNGYLDQGLGTFKQGDGTTSGTNPVILTTNSSLDYTGSGHSHIEIHGGSGVRGNLSAGQSLTLLNGGGNSFSTAQGDITNHGTIVVNGRAGDVYLDMRDHTLTNAGVLVFAGGGAAGRPGVIGNLLNRATLRIGSNAILQGGIGARTTLTQTAGSTTIAAGAVFDFGHAQAGFKILGGTVSGTGTLLGSGVTNSGGTVGPGVPGTLTIQGFYAQGAGGKTEIPLAGKADSGRVAVTGDISLRGSLVFSPSAAYVGSSKVGDSFSPLSFGGSRTGAFGEILSHPSLGRCKAFAVSYGDANHVVRARVIVPPPCRALTLRHVAFAPKAFPAQKGTTLKAKLSAPATLKVVVKQRIEAPCGPRSQHRRCPKMVTRTKLSLAAHAGDNRLAFRVPSLSPGRYTAAIMAVDAAGRHSSTVTLAFRVETAS